MDDDCDKSGIGTTEEDGWRNDGAGWWLALSREMAPSARTDVSDGGGVSAFPPKEASSEHVADTLVCRRHCVRFHAGVTFAGVVRYDYLLQCAACNLAALCCRLLIHSGDICTELPT